MDTLILNAGSSSVKFRLYRDEKVVLDGVVDRIGPDATLSLDGKERPFPADSHKEAGLAVLAQLETEPDMVVHRVVHGGQYRKPVKITSAVLEELEGLTELAPLHMPPALSIIHLFRDRTDAKQIACFDTMFHRTMPAVAKTYAIPQDIARKYHIEHYGFHGLAHKAMLRFAAGRMDRPMSRCTLITCQLGNGASVCAIRNGKSVDTSMGFTPLEGLMMGTRSGDIDPAIIEYLCEKEGKSVQEILDMLETESGFYGLTGTNDVRDILEREKSDKTAKFALDLFAYRVKKLIGSYYAILGKPDAVVLGGGIPRATAMRQRILEGLEHLGIEVNGFKVKHDSPVLVTSDGLPVWVVEVDEQEEMLKLAARFRPRG